MLAGRPVPDHDHPHALTVAAARGESGVVEDALEHLVGQWIIGEPPGRTRGTHDVV